MRSSGCLLGWMVLLVAAIIWVPIGSVQGIVDPISGDYLVRAADRIVVGTVTWKETRWTPDHSMIYTYVTINVRECLKGAINLNDPIVRVEGGQVGPDVLWVGDMPEFRLGEPVLLFLRSVEDGYFEVIAGDEGFIPLSRNSLPVAVYRSWIRTILNGSVPAQNVVPAPSVTPRAKILISIQPDAVAEREAIWAVSATDQQAARALGTRTGIKDFDAIGEELGLLWIEQIAGDHQFYGLIFPFESPFEDPWDEVAARYSQLPFIKFTVVFYPIPVEQNGQYPDLFANEELVEIVVREDASEMNEALFLAGWPPEKVTEAEQTGFPRTGLADFDSIGARFGLLWIQRLWGADLEPLIKSQGSYTLHFPMGSSVESIIAAYARLPFIKYAGPGRVPIYLDSLVERLTWGRIKHLAVPAETGGLRWVN